MDYTPTLLDLMGAPADATDLTRTMIQNIERGPIHNSFLPGAAVMGFDGETYDHKQDRTRLFKQLQAVLATMIDGEWHTLGDLEAKLNYPQASISARLRDLRKCRFGSHTVERRRVTGGLFEYRLPFEPAHSAHDAGGS